MTLSTITQVDGDLSALFEGPDTPQHPRRTCFAPLSTVSLSEGRLCAVREGNGQKPTKIVVSRGPLPGNSSEVAAFDDSSTTYAPLTTFEPYPGQDYGSTLTSIFVGF